MADFNRRTFLAGLAAAPAAAQPPVGKDVVIPLTLERNQLWAPVRIDDQGPYRFLITLAADTHQIARDLAKTLRLEPIAEGDVGGGARRKATYLYKAKKLELGGVITQRNSLLVGVVRSGPLLDGAFVPAFRRISVGYDFERGLLTLRPGAPGVEG